MSVSALMTKATLEAASNAAAAAAGGAVDFDFDKSVLVTMVLFLVLMLVLKPTLYDPMLKLFAEREERTEHTKDRARKMDKKSAEALADYEAAMAKARAAAGGEREKLRADALRAENDILAKVRASTAHTLDAGRKSAQDEVASVRASLKGQAAELGRDVASRVLGREIPS